MIRRRSVLLAAALVAVACVMTAAALAVEPRVRTGLAWPLAPLGDWRGGAFRADPDAASVDLDALADKARRDMPGCVAFVDETDEPILVVGPPAGSWNLGPLERWRDRAGLPLLDPDPIACSGSTPAWFSAPRRAHDLAVACAATIAATVIVVAVGRRTTPAA